MYLMCTTENDYREYKIIDTNCKSLIEFDRYIKHFHINIRKGNKNLQPKADTYVSECHFIQT